MKKVIKNFVEDLNYSKLILGVSNVPKKKLYEKLKEDDVNKLYRLNSCYENYLLYIENCDLLDVNTKNIFDYGDSLLSLVDEGYSIVPLEYDNEKDEWYFEIYLDGLERR